MAGTGPEIRGIIATCLTPFDRERQVDYTALAREVDYLVRDCRADAIAIGATEDAEYTMLRWEQRKELMARGTEIVARRAPVIVGISHPSPDRAVELAEHAAAVGADAVHLLMPIRLWGGEPDPDEIHDYVADIARRSPLPVCVAHNRGPGADPPIPLYVRISEVFNAPYILETSGDVTKISRLIEEIDRRCTARYFTTGESLLLNLVLGGSGAALPPPAARIGAEVVRAFREGDIPRATEWQRILGLFPSRWARFGAPPVMKAAMHHLGIDLGTPMPPYGVLPKWDDAQIRQFLEEVGLKEPGEDAPAPAGTLAPIGLDRSRLAGAGPAPGEAEDSGRAPRRRGRNRRGSSVTDFH
ncbi:MAG TPA: dihydrodipicolinate synthase family protein [bacterium]|nr:dihydrodipicolinate synthase family protein [bacterium]